MIHGQNNNFFTTTTNPPLIPDTSATVATYFGSPQYHPRKISPIPSLPLLPTPTKNALNSIRSKLLNDNGSTACAKASTPKTTRGRKNAKVSKEQAATAEQLLIDFFRENQAKPLKTFCIDADLPDSRYHSIRRRAMKCPILAEIMKLQSTKTGFTKEMSTRAVNVLVPRITSALPSSKSLVDEIKQLHSYHKKISNSNIEIQHCLKGDPQFINCVQILFQQNDIAVVECDDGTLIQKCEGCSRNMTCNEIIVVRKQKNNSGCCDSCKKFNENGIWSEVTRKRNYDNQVAHDSRTNWKALTPVQQSKRSRNHTEAKMKLRQEIETLKKKLATKTPLIDNEIKTD